MIAPKVKTSEKNDRKKKRLERQSPAKNPKKMETKKCDEHGSVLFFPIEFFIVVSEQEKENNDKLHTHAQWIKFNNQKTRTSVLLFFGCDRM